MDTIRKMALLVIGAGLFGTSGVAAQQMGQVSVTCDDGSQFSNGIEFTIIQMRAGYDYTATAVGLNGFDPVLAVLGENGDGLCSDDAPTAARYAANLPTTGYVAPSSLSAQITFMPDGRAGSLQDVSLVVGGYGDQAGEFLLILEGLGVTAADNGGDPAVVTITPAMIKSGVPLDVYMITRGQSNVDPLVRMVDADYNTLTTDEGDPIQCDDAGTNLCWAGSSDLSNSTVTIATGSLPGWQYDAYLSLDLSDMVLGKDRAANGLQFLMSSYEGTSGQYLLVFHAGQ